MAFEDLSWLFTCDSRNRGIARLNFDEAALLYRAVRATEGDMLEIGRRFGGSTVIMLEASGGDTGSRRVTSIDFDPDHKPAVSDYFARPAIAGRLDLLVQDSRQAVGGRSYGMLFIDGDHSYDGVKADTEAHWSALHGPGDPLAVFHDAVPNAGFDHDPEGTLAHAPGVLQYTDELVASGAAERVETAASMLMVRKLSDRLP